MIAYSLKNKISGEKLLQEIDRMINKSQEPKDSLILYIDVRSVSQENNSLIPKLEYKGTDDLSQPILTD